MQVFLISRAVILSPSLQLPVSLPQGAPSPHLHSKYDQRHPSPRPFDMANSARARRDEEDEDDVPPGARTLVCKTGPALEAAAAAGGV
jgi:hypothetical protein